MIPAIDADTRAGWTTELYAVFDELNAVHFGNMLPRPDIRLTACRTPGSYLYVGNVIEINIGMVVHCTCFDRVMHARSVLLHELAHMALYHRIGRLDFNRGASHGPAFAKLCNSIGAVYGWQRVKPIPRSGRQRSGRACTAWPGNVAGDHADRVDFRESWKLCKRDAVLNRQTPAAGAPVQDADASYLIRFSIADVESYLRGRAAMSLESIRQALRGAGYSL